jgi:hypothetical protein
LSLSLKKWLGVDLAEEERENRLNLNSYIGQQARLEIEPSVSKAGRNFDKIIDILPPGPVKMVVSGCYRSKENQ